MGLPPPPFRFLPKEQTEWQEECEYSIPGREGRTWHTFSSPHQVDEGGVCSESAKGATRCATYNTVHVGCGNASYLSHPNREPLSGIESETAIGRIRANLVLLDIPLQHKCLSVQLCLQKISPWWSFQWKHAHEGARGRAERRRGPSPSCRARRPRGSGGPPPPAPRGKRRRRRR